MLCLCPLCMETSPCKKFCMDCSRALLCPKPRCQQCGEQLAKPQLFCRNCIESLVPWERLSIVGPFVEPWSILIKQLKYQRKLTLLHPMAHLLAQSILAQRNRLTQTAWHIAAMPMHSQRLEQRGYNQSGLLAQALSQLLNLPYQQPLWRKHHTEPLEQLNRAQRQQTMAHAFACQPLTGSWILVDDVFTTGASMMAASQAMKQAGAHRVWLATLAKTPV